MVRCLCTLAAEADGIRAGRNYELCVLEERHYMGRDTELRLDTVVFGGGTAGLWLLDHLVRLGRRAVLLEAAELGTGQTVAAQGILHGGYKYTLKDLFSSSATAIRDMPKQWRRCLAGDAEPDLSSVSLRSSSCHLWHTESITSKVGMLGARAVLSVTPEPVSADDVPAALRLCPGTVFKMDEQVIDPRSFVDVVSARHDGLVLKIEMAAGGLELDRGSDPPTIRITCPGHVLILRPDTVVFTAGDGNQDLRTRAGLDSGGEQRRPLHMVVAKGPLPELNGHCIDQAHTRVTITTQPGTAAAEAVWQIGGQISEDGIHMDAKQLIAHTQSELADVLPDVDFSGCDWTTYRVDRVEGAGPRGRRPDDVCCMEDGRFITAWPTKLVLAPRLAERISNLLPAPCAEADDPREATASWPRPAVAPFPWCREDTVWTDAN